MSRLTRDGTAEPVSRDQILRHERGQGNIHFFCSADHVQDWHGNLTRLIYTLAICVTMHGDLRQVCSEIPYDYEILLYFCSAVYAAHVMQSGVFALLTTSTPITSHFLVLSLSSGGTSLLFPTRSLTCPLHASTV